MRWGRAGDLGELIGKILRGGETKFLGNLGNTLFTFMEHLFRRLDLGVGDGFADTDARSLFVKGGKPRPAVVKIIGNGLYAQLSGKILLYVSGDLVGQISLKCLVELAGRYNIALFHSGIPEQKYQKLLQITADHLLRTHRGVGAGDKTEQMQPFHLGNKGILQFPNHTFHQRKGCICGAQNGILKGKKIIVIVAGKGQHESPCVGIFNIQTVADARLDQDQLPLFQRDGVFSVIYKNRAV